MRCPTMNFDGFVKSPSAALRCILARLNAALRLCFAGFNRVNHCGVPICTPHSSGFARLASEAFYFAILILSFYGFINFRCVAFTGYPEERI